MEGEGHLVSQSAIGIAFRAAKRFFDITAAAVGMVRVHILSRISQSPLLGRCAHSVRRRCHAQLTVLAANGGVEEPSAYTSVERREAADIDAVGKYEPKLTENGIPADVLAKLLPGDDVIELEMPVVGGNLAYRFVKRAFDVVSCSCALIILAIPMGVIALKIKSESPGPVIFAQRRVGKGGRIFNMYKFRSMYIDAEARGARWAQGDDPRVTPFGKVMRKTRMDEIPQFWNVVKGDMTLIGPRPERPAFCAEFEKRIHGWHYRTMVTPGLSGLAQVTGGYDLLPKEKVVLDLEYIERRSIAMDAKIILKTLGVVSTGEGAR